MNTAFRFYPPARIILFALLFISAQTTASCIPGFIYSRYVGNVAADSQCTDSTIQDAINNATCPGTTIYITNELSYANQHLSISGKSVNLVGSASSQCGVIVHGLTAGGPPGRIPVGGNGIDPVIAISGNAHVLLANLDISGGKGPDSSLAGGGGVSFNAAGGALTLNNLDVHDNSSGYGGGAGIYGDGTLTISGTRIASNHAQYGGGVSAASSYIGHIELLLADNPAIATEISSNTARNGGGGIYASGNLHLSAIADAPNRIVIHDNVVGDPNSGGSGGGIYFSGTGTADIALPGAGIHSNSADDGAGIAVMSSSSGNALLRLFSTSSMDVTTLFGNSATYTGGGLLVGPGTSTHATACLFDVAIANNTAPQDGSAINVENGGRLIVNPGNDPECKFADVAALGAVHCDSSTLNCNRIIFNQSGSGNSNSAPAAIDFTGAAVISARRLHLESNSGGYAIHGEYAAGAQLAFSECVIDHNTVSRELVKVQGAPISFDGCTFADDDIGASAVFAWDTGLSLTRSIVRESRQVFSLFSGVTANYLILNEPKMPTNSSVLYVDPLFVDAANGNYHLQTSSQAIDFAPLGAESGSTDFDNRSREVDLPGVANLFGARDLGAFEQQRQFACDDQSDVLFCDGFEIY